MSDEQDLHFMRIAIEASRASRSEGNAPYGAALVSAAGGLLHVSRNSQVSTDDCTAHAEVNLIREVCAQQGSAALANATVYASGEPCAMCAGALFWARVRRVVYGMRNETMMREAGGSTLPIGCRQVLQAGGSHGVEVSGPLLEDEALEVLKGK